MTRRRLRHATEAVLSLSFFLSSFVSASANDGVEAANEYIKENAARILWEFADFLELPNVTKNVTDLEKNAQYIDKMFSAAGANVRVLKLEDKAPIVIGKLGANSDRRTIGVYCHYDAQPVEPLSEWRHGPFQPTLYTGAFEEGGTKIELPATGDNVEADWRMYCRASADDRGPIYALKLALDALRENNIPLSSNLVFLFEGEEESGSTNLEMYLSKYRDMLSGVDIWLICDGPVHQSGKPIIVFGVRGISGFEVSLYGASRRTTDGTSAPRPLHSGHYGNWAPNPALMLSQLLAGMKDAQGRVLIDGFYESAQPLGRLEREALARMPRMDDALMKEFGLARVEGDGESLEELINRPSLNIRGISAASVGSAARTIIPAEATASVDIRLVKGNDPNKMLDLVEHHIKQEGYHIVRTPPDFETRLKHAPIAMFSRRPRYRAARTPMNLAAVSEITSALRVAAGEEVIHQPTMGGSLPLYVFEESLQTPFLIVPLVNYDNNQHAPNENLRVGQLWYGVRALASILSHTSE